MAKKKTSGRKAAREKTPAAGSLDSYLQLANHAARWASPHDRVAAHPALRPYIKRVPRSVVADRQFWFGEVLSDLYRDAQRDLNPTELKRLDSVMNLMTAKPPAGYGSAKPTTIYHARKKRPAQLDREITEALAQPGRRSHSTKQRRAIRADKLGHPDRIMLDGKRLTVVSNRPTRLRDGTVKFAVNTEYSTVAHHVVLPADEMIEVGWA